MKIHNALINILKQKTLKAENPVDLLTDIIPMSKEAAYRRLRGEISMSLEEAVKICKRLNISIDHLIEVEEGGMHGFVFEPFSPPDPWIGYCNILEGIRDALLAVKDDPSAFIYSASNVIPMAAYHFKELNKFRHFKWIYQMQPGNSRMPFKDMVVPEKALEIQRTCYELSQEVMTYVILDSEICRHAVDDLKYLKELQIVTSIEVNKIKKELHDFLIYYEEMIAKGRFESGKPFMVYVTNTFIDAAYDYIESRELRVCAFNVFGLNYLSSFSPVLCNVQKTWLESTMRFSTLISRSGEKQRMEYFKNQHEIIDEL